LTPDGTGKASTLSESEIIAALPPQSISHLAKANAPDGIGAIGRNQKAYFSEIKPFIENMR
jgi:hypothetical protein